MLPSPYLLSFSSLLFVGSRLFLFALTSKIESFLRCLSSNNSCFVIVPSASAVKPARNLTSSKESKAAL